jgi:predicted alpha/beta hydrolase family esterase
MHCHLQELSEFFPCETPSDLFCEDALLVGSTNDPYMDESELLRLQAELGVDIELVKNGGHLNSDSGYGKWDWIVQQVKQV